MNRRTLLKSMGAAALSTPIAAAVARLRKQREKAVIGIGLYTVRSMMKEGVERTLNTLAGLGYREVEFAGYYDHSAEDVTRMLKSAGLKAPSAHLWPKLFETDFDRALEFAQSVGHEFLVMPSIAHEMRNLDGFKYVADMLNKAGMKAKEAGITVAYHNHAFEFETIDGITPYDLLLDRTDADLVKLELDLYWTHVAGVDPVSIIDRFPGRVPLIHVKDQTASGEMTEVGSGVIDFSPVFENAEKAGLRHYLVEHDNPQDALASVAKSVSYMKKTFPRFSA